MSVALPQKPLSQQTSGVISRLAALRTQIAAWFWVDGLVRVLWIALALIAVDLAIDWFFRLDKPQRVVMLVLMLGVIVWRIYRRLVRPLSATMSDDALALSVEAGNKQLGQGLISALQLSRMENVEARGMSPVLVQETVRRGAAAAEKVSFGSVLDGKEFRLNALLLAIAVGMFAVIGYGIVATNTLSIWFNRNIMLGNGTWPQKTYLVIERKNEDGTIVFPRGEDWTQTVTVTEESEIVPETVYLDFRRARGRAPVTMKKTSERQFEATFASVIEPFEFRARGGDAVTEWVRVELVEQPAVETLKLMVTPPKYTGAGPEELPAGKGPYYVLPGSSLRIEGKANKELVRGEIHYEGKALIQPKPAPEKPAALKGLEKLLDGKGIDFAGQIAPPKIVEGTYVFQLEDTLGLTGRRPTTFAIRKRTDREPRVRVKLIGVGGMVVQKARVPFNCRVTDDFGVTGAEVAYRWKGDDMTQPDGEGKLAFESIKDALGEPDLVFDEVIELEPLKIPTGTGLSFRFEAGDNDDVSGPNVGKSSEFLVRVVTEEELRTDLLRREKEQRQEFERLIKNQEDLLTDSRALEAGVKGQAKLTPEQKDQLIQYHKRQKLVGQNTGAIAERMASIVIEVQNNRLEEDGGRLQTRLTKEIIEPMRAVADEMIPAALNGLDKVRRQSDDVAARDATLAETIAQQTDTAAKMKEILEHMVKSEGFQEAVNLLYEIQKAQTDVHSQTTKEQQERIKRILEGDAAKPSETPKPSEAPKASESPQP